MLFNFEVGFNDVYCFGLFYIVVGMYFFDVEGVVFY